MVIARPAGLADVDFQMVARPLHERLQAVRGEVRLDVARPPTLEALEDRLMQAKEAGRPYHALHFDGHGVFAEGGGAAGMFDMAGGGGAGYLLFESADGAEGNRVPAGDLPHCGRSQMQPEQAPSNAILNYLSRADRDLLRPNLEPIDLPVRFRLAEASRPIDAVYFLEAGIASITTSVRHEVPIEIGIVGREGFVNLPALMGIDRSPRETFMQIHGAGFRIGVERLREAMAQSPTLMPILLLYVMSTWCRPPRRCSPTDVRPFQSGWLAGC